MVEPNLFSSESCVSVASHQPKERRWQRLNRRIQESKCALKTKAVFRKLWLIFWKNLILRKRQYIVTTMEVLLPTVLAIITASVRASTPLSTFNRTQIIYPPSTDTDMLNFVYAWTDNVGDTIEMGYVPDTEAVKTFIKTLDGRIRNCPGSQNSQSQPPNCDNTRAKILWKPFKDEHELEAFAAGGGSWRQFPFALVMNGLQFDSAKKKYAAANNKISYTIRMTLESTDEDFKVDTSVFIDENVLRKCDSVNITREDEFYQTFGGLQKIIDKLLMENLLDKKIFGYNIRTEQFPCPAGSGLGRRQFSLFFETLLPMTIVLGFIFMVPSVVRGIVSEKQTGIKELMKMSGLPNWMHWVGWMLNSLVVLICSITIMLFVLYIPFNSDNGAVINHSDFSLWWFVLFIYIIWATTYCFLIASMFERPTLATTVGIVIWLVSYYGLELPLRKEIHALSWGWKLVLCLSPNMGLHFALRMLSGLEAKHGTDEKVGAKWKYIGTPVSAVNSLTLAHILMMLVVCSVLYTLLALYLESVMPTKYGVRKPWYFIFQPATWGFKKQKIANKDAILLRSETEEEGNSFEKAPTNIPIGLEVIKLRKKFENRVVVDDVSLKAFEGQIFCLLGHNGAGKTTMMSMLTGLLPPTSGTAIVNGKKDIRKDMSDIRQNLGLCPQHNLLFENLTVAEHLQFFGMVKGLTRSEAKLQIPNLIDSLQLGNKKNALAMSISGGQKRRLCLGCATIGNTKLLFVDECSSGLDPEARRKVWDLLLKLRKGRTIILTTHFLEEADILGDRIAIMAAGKIQCCGSPDFLKKHYGTGYNLQVSITEQGKPEAILLIVQHSLPSSYLKSHTKKGNVIEVTIAISLKESSTSQFLAMFSDLLSRKTELHILDVGIAVTTMEDVFLKVAEIGQLPENVYLDTCPIILSRSKRVSGRELVFQQFWGLLVKKMLYSLRKPTVTFMMMALPVLLLITGVLIINENLRYHDTTPPLVMSLAPYKDEKILYSTTGDISNRIGNAYFALVGPAAKKINGDVTMELLRIGDDDEIAYFQQYLIAAKFEKTSGTTNLDALYSSIFLHSRPLSINVVTNALIRYLDDKNRNYVLEVTNHPLVLGAFDVVNVAAQRPVEAKSYSGAFGIIVSMGLALLAAGFIVLPIEERRCQAKQLQLMTGISPFLYWGSALLWDYFLFLVCGVIIVICLFIFEDLQRFTVDGGAGIAFLIIAMYGIGAISFSYLVSLVAETPGGGFSVVTIIHLFSGPLLAMAVFFLQDVRQLTDYATMLSVIGRVFPTYGISKSMMTYARLSTINSRCTPVTKVIRDVLCQPSNLKYNGLKSCCENCKELNSPCFKKYHYSTWTYTEAFWHPNGTAVKPFPAAPAIIPELVFMIIPTFLYFGLLMLAEYGLLKRLMNKIRTPTIVKFVKYTNDEDVEAEIERVRSMVQRKATCEDSFVVNNLCKSYGPFAAVSKLTFGVHRGECFGLLGINGAGKTSTFKMMTGAEDISLGNAWMGNLSIKSDITTFLRNIGYCPQFDAILGLLTGQEMLEIFARLRGVKNTKVNSVSRNWLNRFGLLDSADVQCEKYSGGMKRRLSAALALIGHPPLIFFDEPTSGVDPASRRQFWNIIIAVKESGGCIILTSHSMAECEALCSRLGIMVNGEFQCLGRVQALKNKFTEGYTLKIKLNEALSTSSDVDTLTDEVIKQFDPCNLKGQHQNVMEFRITSPDLALDKVFEIMEGIQAQFFSVIDEYSVQQTTLEEVFLSFARKQYGETRRASNVLKRSNGCCGRFRKSLVD